MKNILRVARRLRKIRRRLAQIHQHKHNHYANDVWLKRNVL